MTSILKIFRLTKSDPHQLYHRLQSQVHEVASAVKTRLREITESRFQNAIIATQFFDGKIIIMNIS